MSRIGMFFVLPVLLFSLNSACSGDEKCPLDGRIRDLTQDGAFSPEDLANLEKLIQARPAFYASCGYVSEGSLDMELLWQEVHRLCPGCEGPKEGPAQPFNYSAYIENSGSMDGYVNGNTEFKEALSNLLSDIKIRDLADTLDMYYINAKKSRFPGKMEDFILNLTPKTFRDRRTAPGTTDIANLIREVVEQAPSNEISLIASDFIFSAGKGNNSKDHLTSQEIKLKNIFSGLLHERPERELVFIKLRSKFSGTYYDYEEGLHSVDARRPYYVLVLGPSAGMKAFMDRIDVTRISGYENHYYLKLQDGDALPYKVTQYHKGGSMFRPCTQNPATCIQNPVPAGRGAQEGIFQFSLAVDLSGIYLDESALADVAHYAVTPGSYTLAEVKRISAEEREKDPTLEAYSHFLVLQSDQPALGTIRVSLLDELPEWVAASNSMDDRNQEGAELDSTFGLLYLISGMHEAFQARSPGYARTHLFQLEIEVNR